jgi:predicted metal-dependent enzyme (double-stranded beta helix superfamily)
MSQNLDSLHPLREFVTSMTRLVDRTPSEQYALREGRAFLADLLSAQDWLPHTFAQSEPGAYRQYLLHCDPLERFSVVSFVWGPGSSTPVHDHTVWGLIGVLRGAEICCEYEPTADQRVRISAGEHALEAGAIEAVSPTVGDWHQVRNARDQSDSISIHVYGANIGAVRRHMVDPHTGSIRDFISGYSSPLTPNLWDRSAAVRAQVR